MAQTTSKITSCVGYALRLSARHHFRKEISDHLQCALYYLLHTAQDDGDFIPVERKKRKVVNLFSALHLAEPPRHVCCQTDNALYEQAEPSTELSIMNDMDHRAQAIKCDSAAQTMGEMVSRQFCEDMVQQLQEKMILQTNLVGRLQTRLSQIECQDASSEKRDLHARSSCDRGPLPKPDPQVHGCLPSGTVLRSPDLDALRKSHKEERMLAMKERQAERLLRLREAGVRSPT